MNCKILIIIWILIMSQFLLKSQTVTSVDYLNYKFRYIDSNYKIHIDSATFDSAIVKYGFYKERITRYQDSIGVVVMFELNDWQACNSAKIQLGFSWLRASYYCWLNINEVKQLTYNMGYSHPWRLYQAIMNPDNKSIEVDQLIKSLNMKLHNADPNIVTEGLTRKQFFMLALKNNPVRIEDERIKRLTESYKSRHSTIDSLKIGVVCEKSDCCQKPIIQKSVTLEEKSNY